MQPAKIDDLKTAVIDTHRPVYSVFFIEDSDSVLSGDDEGTFRQWRTDNSQEVVEPIRAEGDETCAAIVSPDHKWLVCGARKISGQKYLEVWDIGAREKVMEIECHTDTVCSLDISSDSTKLAAGTQDHSVLLWNLSTGQVLVGPLQHSGAVDTVRFSPNSDRIAASASTGGDSNTKSIRIYNSENGQQLVVTPVPNNLFISSTLAWSADACQLLAVSYGGASDASVRCFDSSSGFLVNSWLVPDGTYTAFILLAQNQRFIAVVVARILSFWDTLTHAQIGATVECESLVWSVALSKNDELVAIGEDSGQINVLNLREILPEVYFQ